MLPRSETPTKPLQTQGGCTSGGIPAVGTGVGIGVGTPSQGVFRLEKCSSGVIQSHHSTSLTCFDDVRPRFHARTTGFFAVEDSDNGFAFRRLENDFLVNYSLLTFTDLLFHLHGETSSNQKEKSGCRCPIETWCFQGRDCARKEIVSSAALPHRQARSGSALAKVSRRKIDFSFMIYLHEQV